MSNKFYGNRRHFVKSTALSGLGLALAPGLAFSSNPVKKQKAKLGFIGMGLRGTGHLENVLNRDDIEIPAICDIDKSRITIAQSMLMDAGLPKAEAYSEHEFSYEKLLERDDIDGVIISTPWLWHTPMAVASMKAGKYTGLEVSAANTIEECWDLVNTYEKTRSPLMILENVCYRRDVMAILNMIRQDVFGELIHATCGYLHDLRHVKFNDGIQPDGEGVEFGEKAISEAAWRTEHSVKRNADIYPTHGVGPIAVYMDINRGNRFASITSTATKSRGLHKYIVDTAGEDHPNAKVRFKLGDVVTSTIKTSNDESIIVTHDTNLPRPYSLGFKVQGTNGLWMKDGDRIYLEGISEPHEWEDSQKYLQKYDHPLWKKFEDEAVGSGHGGMDFFVLNAFIEIIKRQVDAPLDAYDAAAWSAITPLSELSITNNGEPQDFPDFTRGKWFKRKPVFGFDDQY